MCNRGLLQYIIIRQLLKTLVQTAVGLWRPEPSWGNMISLIWWLSYQTTSITLNGKEQSGRTSIDLGYRNVKMKHLKSLPCHKWTLYLYQMSITLAFKIYQMKWMSGRLTSNGGLWLAHIPCSLSQRSTNKCPLLYVYYVDCMMKTWNTFFLIVQPWITQLHRPHQRYSSTCAAMATTFIHRHIIYPTTCGWFNTQHHFWQSTNVFLSETTDWKTCQKINI